MNTIDSFGYSSTEYNPTYFDGSIGYTFSHTNKLSQDKPTVTIQIPCELLMNTLPCSTEPYIADFCLRRFKGYIDTLNTELRNNSRPSDENGEYYLQIPKGKILVRNGAYFSKCCQRDYEYGSGLTVHLLHDDKTQIFKMCLCILVQVQLPKFKIRKAMQMLCKDLPNSVKKFITEFDVSQMNLAEELGKKQTKIRMWLKNSDFCSFIANGSILPRSKGTDLPMNGAVPFCSPPKDEIEVFGVKGMGIRRGVTVITGGGYSGKSTLLDAISAGIYDHALGDGRELCITDDTAVSIAAEDGRSIKSLNISPFIKWLPGGDTTKFSTDHASGSTSQAANIMEAISYGSKLLLIDEDRSATNFMIRDRMMKELIKKEPITPFTDRVRELHETKNVSTILVIGGSGEYLSVADRVYMMEDYLIHDVTERSKKICEKNGVTAENPAPGDWEQHRILHSEGFTSFPEGKGKERLEVSEMGFILIGDEKIDIRGLNTIVSQEQLQTIGFILRHMEITNNDSVVDIEKKLDEVYRRVESEGVDFLYSSFFTTCERFLDIPRKCDVRAAIERMRKLHYVEWGHNN